MIVIYQTMTKMRNYQQLRKITDVFRGYGIALTGKRKYDHFILDLQMDKIFVQGLVFELEYALEKEIEDHKLHLVEAPAELIALLLD